MLSRSRNLARPGPVFVFIRLDFSRKTVSFAESIREIGG